LRIFDEKRTNDANGAMQLETGITVVSLTLAFMFGHAVGYLMRRISEYKSEEDA